MGAGDISAAGNHLLAALGRDPTQDELNTVKCSTDADVNAAYEDLGRGNKAEDVINGLGRKLKQVLPHSVDIYEISAKASKQELADLFAFCGNVVSMTDLQALPNGRQWSRVTFSDAASVQNALPFNGSIVRDSAIQVVVSGSARPAPFSAETVQSASSPSKAVAPHSFAVPPTVVKPVAPSSGGLQQSYTPSEGSGGLQQFVGNQSTSIISKAIRAGINLQTKVLALDDKYAVTDGLQSVANKIDNAANEIASTVKKPPKPQGK